MKKEIFLSLLCQARELTITLEKAAEEQKSETLKDLLISARFALYAAQDHIKELYKEEE